MGTLAGLRHIYIYNFWAIDRPAAYILGSQSGEALQCKRHLKETGVSENTFPPPPPSPQTGQKAIRPQTRFCLNKKVPSAVSSPFLMKPPRDCRITRVFLITILAVSDILPEFHHTETCLSPPWHQTQIPKPNPSPDSRDTTLNPNYRDGSLASLAFCPHSRVRPKPESPEQILNLNVDPRP